MKKKIFSKATFLLLALMLMLAPMAFNVIASENDVLSIVDER